VVKSAFLRGSVAMVGLAMAMMAMPAVAQEVALTKVREIGAKTTAIAFDNSSGGVFQRFGHTPDDRSFQFFESGEAFDANKPAFSFDLQGPGLAGTYMAAQDFQIFGAAIGGKTDSNSAIASWLGKTGEVNGFRASLPDIGESKEAATFDWGGLTSVNWFQDNTGTYVLGSHNSSTWSLFRMQGLDIEASHKFEAKSLGFAFMLDGTLFTGASSREGVVTNAFNFEKGAMSDVNYKFSGFASDNLAITGTAYDVKSDRLYLTDSGNDMIFAVSNARELFASFGGGGGGGGGGIPGIPGGGGGGSPGAVPEPDSWAMMLTGFGLIGFLLRRRKPARAIA